MDVKGEDDGEGGDMAHPSSTTLAGEEGERVDRDALARGGLRVVMWDWRSVVTVDRRESKVEVSLREGAIGNTHGPGRAAGT